MSNKIRKITKNSKGNVINYEVIVNGRPKAVSPSEIGDYIPGFKGTKSK